MLSCLSYTAQAYQPRNSTTLSGLNLPTPATNQETEPQVNLVEAILQLRLCHPRCTKLTMKIGHHTQHGPQTCSVVTDIHWIYDHVIKRPLPVFLEVSAIFELSPMPLGSLCIILPLHPAQLTMFS